jgi:zinc transport system ATP-binding protein
MASTPVISFNNVCFRYDQSEVLHNVNFSLFERESTSIVGPNGGGKTTLVKLILGLHKPQSGSISVLGSTPSESSRRIGYMPQSSHFDQSFPIQVLDIVLMGRLGKRRSPFYNRTDKQAAMQALDETGLADLAARPFASLSGGQRQRVLIARALACDPKLLLLDEPTAHVDPAMEEQVNETLAGLAKRLTVITVTHELGFVARRVDRVLCVNRTVKLHPTSEITGEIIQEIYGSDLRMVRHDHQCSEKGHQHA